MSETYQKVAYIGLRKEDGSVLVGVPLYIKLNDVQGKTTLKSQEEIISNITEEMMKRYQQQFGAFVEKRKREKIEKLSIENKVSKPKTRSTKKQRRLN